MGDIETETVSRSLDDHEYHNGVNGRTFFAFQVVLSLVTTAFCIGMIATKGQEGIYLPVMTGILGVWLPAPRPPNLEKSTK
jgi:hypothetical protein